MRKRKLTAKRARELLRYDRATGWLIWRRDVWARGRLVGTKGSRAGSGRGNPYRRITIDGARYQEHQVIWLMVKGEWLRRNQIDHANRRKQDNRWRNLREAHQSQNNYNAGAKSNNTTGLKWVRNKGDGKYQASVQLYLGTWRSARRAHAFARDFVRQHHREFFHAGARA